MHGFIHLLLEAYASERIGPQHLPEIKRLTGVPGPTLATQRYPDQLTLKLVQVIASLQGTDPDDLLYNFGIYFMNAPLLEHTYQALLEGHRSARDFLQALPDTYQALQTSLQEASLPEFHYIDHDANLLEIIYDSPRRLCRLLMGMLEGVGLRFNERLEVREIECQYRGAPACRLLVRFLPVQPSGPRLEYPSLSRAPGSGPQTPSGPLPDYPYAPQETPAPQEFSSFPAASQTRDREQDLLVLQVLSGQLPTRGQISRPLANAAQHPLPLALTLFEIAHRLNAGGFSGDQVRLSLIQRSLSRLSAQGLVEGKLDRSVRTSDTSQDALAFGGKGVLAAQRYRITSTGQTWLQEMQRR